MSGRIGTAARLLLLLGAAWAAQPSQPAQAADDAAAYAWQQHPGAQLPLDARFRDASGQPVALAELVRGLPVILDLGYFHCPSLCGLIRADLFNALRGSGLVAGRDYRLVALSIDPTETPADAAEAKSGDVAQFAPGETFVGTDWRYLTGPAPAIAAVTDAVGFRDRYDPKYKQFLHPAGLVVLTGTGTVSGYLLGMGFGAGDLRAAVLRAGQGGIAKAALPVLLLCFHFDPATGRYTLAIYKLLRLMAVLTVLTVAGLLVALNRHKGRRA